MPMLNVEADEVHANQVHLQYSGIKVVRCLLPLLDAKAHISSMQARHTCSTGAQVLNSHAPQHPSNVTHRAVAQAEHADHRPARAERADHHLARAEHADHHQGTKKAMQARAKQAS